MCGRFAIYSKAPALSRALRIPLELSDVVPRFNVAPGTWVMGIRQLEHDEPPEQLEFWWGYRPKWAKGKAAQPINARVETVATSGYFKNAFARHRCLVPADGWFEWIATETGKQPHYLTRTDREPFAFAGIYASREDGSLGCAILTEPARGSAAEVHDRMPLILDEASIEPWLDPDLTDRETIRNVVRHIDAGLIEHWTVSRAVNKPAEGQGTELINPA
ncbi:SOS response-associated peptidase [Billgrantia sp. C5P2]|uniref:SOS response-associated peptidase n=1 Tax=Billgrantia sp. C5P2 TaxID=3436239 RepID=UPI003DA37413